jgi:hypothetical protein
MRLSVPGKAFILGEYLALHTSQGLLAALSPRFYWDPGVAQSFSSKSPVGRFFAQYGVFQGGITSQSRSLGNGSSSAEFILAYYAHLMSQNPVYSPIGRVWDIYVEFQNLWKDLQPGEVRPSGLDVCSQVLGGLTYIDASAKYFKTLDKKVWPGLWVLRAPLHLKQATHKHLQELKLSQVDFVKLEQLLTLGLQQLEGCDDRGFGKTLTDYGEVLAKDGLEAENTTRVKESLGALPGVWGIKGSGAMQADMLIMQTDPGLQEWGEDELMLQIQKLDLTVLTKGYRSEPGILLG